MKAIVKCEPSPGAIALRRWLEKKKLSIQEFCMLNGLDRIQVQRILRGELHRISVDFASKVERATGIRMHVWVRP